MCNNFKSFIKDILDFDLQDDFIFIKDKDFNYVYANEKFCNFFNVNLESLQGKNDSYFMKDTLYINKCRESDISAFNNNFVISNEVVFGDNYHVLKLKINLHKHSQGILCLARLCNLSQN